MEPGATVIEDPLPTKVPGQPPEYQFQEAPVPSEPPPTVNVVAPPHVGLTLALAQDGPTDCMQEGA